MGGKNPAVPGNPPVVKALLLAAGFGTRLRPHTLKTPKALFQIGGVTLLERLIRQLVSAGCDAIAINTHHLHEKIHAFVSERRFPVPVFLRHEPELLGTGGAIGSLGDFRDDAPFLVVNSDILTTIDFKEVYAFHCERPHPATLVLTETSSLNSVWVENDRRVTGFDNPPAEPLHSGCRRLTFTGIQVLSPPVLSYFPPDRFFHSVDGYRRMMSDGGVIGAFVAEGYEWTDAGTVPRFREAAIETLAPVALARAYPGSACGKHRIQPLAGDGSDRQWHRIARDGHTLVAADHGIREHDGQTEADAFADIGSHLEKCGVPVPRIFLEDRFSGIVFMEDLGDSRLQTEIHRAQTAEDIMALYRPVLSDLVTLWTDGYEGFDPGWTCQTPVFDDALVLERECRYFVESFLCGYLNRSDRFEDFEGEFRFLAGEIMQYAVWGLIHRDMQSRNIMWRGGRPRFIDFQGARKGPIQYDLASLVMDPYADLSAEIQESLIVECLRLLSRKRIIDEARFRKGYSCCAVSRHLQMLGAFSFLSRVKKKPVFETYIPKTIASLSRLLTAEDASAVFPRLSRIVSEIGGCLRGMRS